MFNSKDNKKDKGIQEEAPVTDQPKFNQQQINDLVEKATSAHNHEQFARRVSASTLKWAATELMAQTKIENDPFVIIVLSELAIRFLKAADGIVK